MQNRIPTFLIDTLNLNTIKKGFTLVLCFSRRWTVAPFFERFDKLRFNKKKCHLLVFDNTDNALLEQELVDKARDIQNQFLSVRYLKTYREGGSVLRGQPNFDFYKSKIYPISQMQFDIPKYIFTKTFVQLEDDEPPQNPCTITRLLKILKRKGVGLATGISTYRNHDKTPVGIGVHQLVKMQGNRIIERVGCWPDEKGIKEVAATGFYCFAVYTDLWRKCLDDSKKVVRGLAHWAFDTWTTNRIVKRKFKILADFSCWCDHMQAFPGGPYRFNQKDAILDAYIYIPELKVYAYWQNRAGYGWVIHHDGKNIRRNETRISTEILQR